LVARNKVISKSGSSYVSENGESYGPCSYSPYEVNPHKMAGKHINECGSLNCSYYRRITYNRAGGTAGTVASIGAGVGFWTALALTPFTGGASIAVAAGLSTAASASAVGGTALTWAGMTETRNGVENELKLKWQNEKLKEKISSLQSELNEVKSKYRRGELSNYRLREIIREKEAKIRELETENKKISTESWERWQAIEKLEETIRELKSML
jgi:hypothetical protein